MMLMMMMMLRLIINEGIILSVPHSLESTTPSLLRISPSLNNSSPIQLHQSIVLEFDQEVQLYRRNIHIIVRDLRVPEYIYLNVKVNTMDLMKKDTNPFAISITIPLKYFIPSAMYSVR